MESYKTPKGIESISKAIAKKKIKAKVAKAPKSAPEASIPAEPTKLKTSSVEHSESESASAEPYTKARAKLQYNISQYEKGLSKGLSPKGSAKKKLRDSVKEYKQYKDTDAAKNYRRIEKMQELDYKMKGLFGE